MKRSIFVLVILFYLFTGGCVKDNLPDDIINLQEYNGLYLAQSNIGSAGNAVIYNIVPTDTVFPAYSVYLGGQVASKNIHITFSVVPTLVDSFNTAKMPNLKAVLLPAEAYTMQETATLKSGTSHTSPVNITLKTELLNPNGRYVLPLTFSTDDNQYKIDTTRNIIFLTFNVSPSTKGVWIGNIPELVDNLVTLGDDTRPMVTDFFGDIAVKDRKGNLIIYPLESNSDTNRLGPPDTLVKASVRNDFAITSFLFFNDQLNALMGTPFTGSNNTRMVRWAVTPRQRDVKGSATVATLVSHTVNASYKLYYTWWMGYDGWMHFCTSGGAGRAYAVNPATPATFTQMSAGINETIYQFWTCVDGANVCNHSDGLRLWGYGLTRFGHTVDNPVALASTITQGKNFFTNYAKFVSIYKRDFIGVRKNGDIILWKRFNRNLWYDGNDYIKP